MVSVLFEEEMKLNYLKKYLFIVLLLSTGFVYAGFDEGVKAHVKGEYETAFIEFRRLAEQGHIEAQSNLAWMYHKGQGVAQDYKEAAKWYLKAAEQGNDSAQFMIAISYFKGEGISQDYTKAAKWYIKSANQGYFKSQLNLALMYAKGQGVPRDDVQSYMWFNVAVASGNNNYTKYRDIIAKDMTPSQIAEAQKLARDWKPKK